MAPTVDSATPPFSVIALFLPGITSPLLPLSQDSRYDKVSGKDFGQVISETMVPAPLAPDCEIYEPCKGPLMSFRIIIDRLPPFLFETCNHERPCESGLRREHGCDKILEESQLVYVGNSLGRPGDTHHIDVLVCEDERGI